MNKEVKKIFLALILYALSGGIFYNFKELWLANNNLSTESIGIVYSLCALLCVSSIFVCSNIITKKRLKKFTSVLLLLKSLILISLYFLNNTGLNVLIKFLIMVDYVIDVEVYACIYPIVSLITKNDKIYALKKLVYGFAYYLGILTSSLLLGKTIIKLNIDFNTYALVGSIFMFLSFILLNNINLKGCVGKNDKKNYNAFYNVLSIIKSDNITKCYLLFCFLGQISYASINGLIITLLTNNLGFSPSEAANFNLIVGILAVFLGTIILHKLTLKNDYINFSIKFVGRLITYFLAIIFNSKIMFLLAIFYTLITSESYVHIYEAPYINRFSSDNQLAFCNLKEMTTYFGKAIGNLFCGMAIILGTRYNFLFSFIFCSIQIIFGFIAIRLRKKENGVVEL